MQADRLTCYQLPVIRDPSSDGEGLEAESHHVIVEAIKGWVLLPTEPSAVDVQRFGFDHSTKWAITTTW